jgi:hypothetical protein
MIIYLTEVVINEIYMIFVYYSDLNKLHGLLYYTLKQDHMD